jgi:predicted AAA+ superfamily ATPase
MPHERKRFIEYRLMKLATFWPVIGLIGMRQVGKSTILRTRLKIKNYITLDDDDNRLDAESSAKAFLARYHEESTAIDEIQKVPKLFDALKSIVDRKKIPGRWFISGSVAFSAKIGIRESLTGRIGINHLYPMCFAEVKQLPQKMLKDGNAFLNFKEARVSIEDFVPQMFLGGLPVPAFICEASMRSEYWNSWVETSLVRDVAKFYGKGFDSEYCLSLVRMMSRAFLDGEPMSLSYIDGDKRKARRYIEAMENNFFLRKISMHELGTGGDYWIFGDAGLAYHLASKKIGPELSLTIARHYILNEIFCLNEYQGHPLPKRCFKSPKGPIIDFVWNNIPIKIVNENVTPTTMEYHQRSVLGAMKKLDSKRGLILAPVNIVHLPKSGVCLLPWSYFS